MASLIERMTWATRLGLRQLGGVRLAALLVTVFAAGLVSYSHLVVRPESDALDSQYLAASPNVQRETQAFPPLSQTAQLPGWLQEHAEAAGLDMGDAQYQLETAGKRYRYRVVLPLTGRYPSLRQFLADALDHFPNLALESMQIQRRSASDTALEMRLSLVFHLEASR